MARRYSSTWRRPSVDALPPSGGEAPAFVIGSDGDDAVAEREMGHGDVMTSDR